MSVEIPPAQDVPTLKQCEQVVILRAMTGRKRHEAADALGMAVRTLTDRLRSYGVPPRLQNSQAEPDRIAPDPQDLAQVIRFLGGALPAGDQVDEVRRQHQQQIARLKHEHQQQVRDLTRQLNRAESALKKATKLNDHLLHEQMHPTRKQLSDPDPRFPLTPHDIAQRREEMFAER